jgi:hypothetical protein
LGCGRGRRLNGVGHGEEGSSRGETVRSGRSGYKNVSTTCNQEPTAMKFAVSPPVLIVLILVALYLHLSSKKDQS